MGFRKSHPAANALPAPAPTTPNPADQVAAQLRAAQAELEAQGAKPAAPVLVSSPVPQQATATQRAVSTFLSDDEAQLGALTAAADVDSDGPSQVFPTVTQQAGPTGGALIISKGTERQWPNIDLPEGKRPFKAMFLAYRFAVTAWPAGYEDASGAGTKGPKPRPVFSCAIPGTERDLAGKLMLAGKRYQYCARDKKDAWDAANNGPGHIRPQVELLLLEPESGTVFVLQTCAHYSSAQYAREALSGLVVEVDGAKVLRPFVGQFAVDTVEESSKGGNTFKIHQLKISRLDVASDPEALDMAKQFDAWRSSAAPALVQQVTDWRSGADAPITQTARDALALGASM
jgi:hypothetical protein